MLFYLEDQAQGYGHYLKIGEAHRLENNGRIPVVLIEAQVGEYISEDDIVRIDNSWYQKVIQNIRKYFYRNLNEKSCY
ncbi:hypothetical protein CDV26_09020 [Francisella halioticida]|uniref:Mannose-6-phosphate isomerase type II C-terminal domain-containing protein n=1 Tax=Francisella halioticida TaxID=549298 RepID=A0ABM6M2F2_9GAMM|nr:hypothetical protein CDV26_09020 [Francisella halioticida]